MILGSLNGSCHAESNAKLWLDLAFADRTSSQERFLSK
jgi:hypothetical protein